MAGTLTMALGPSDFPSSPTVTDSGHVRSFEHTYEWVRPLLRRVPITRVVNVTPLDVVELPVWSAVTPLAKDLKVHAGKGRSSLASKLSAIMEAIERVSAEQLPAGQALRASYNQLASTPRELEPIDPERFDLPYQTEYRPDREISWTAAYDLISRRHYWVPVDLVISPSCEGVTHGVETNGLASGNTILEATLHALYEVIERDAISIADFGDMMGEATDPRLEPVRMIDPASLPAQARAWFGSLTSEEMRLGIRHMTTDVGVPVYGALLVDPQFPGAMGEAISFAGYGADLTPDRAVFRAVTEAVQAHTIVMLGARDTYEGNRPIPDRAQMLWRKLGLLHSTHLEPFPAAEAPGVAGADLRDNLDQVLARLERAGFAHCLVTSLTRADLGVPVVRVLVPGLAPPYGASTRRVSHRLLRRIVP